MRLGRSMSNDGAAPVRAGATAVLCRALLVAALCVVAVPAAASANTLWVSTHTPSPPFANCEHPGYNSIQAAVNAPGTAIHVCPGTYNEQISHYNVLSTLEQMYGLPKTGYAVNAPAITDIWG